MRKPKPVYVTRNELVIPNFGTIKKGHVVKVLDDNTPLNQSYRCVVYAVNWSILDDDIWFDISPVFPIMKSEFKSKLEELT